MLYNEEPQEPSLTVESSNSISAIHFSVIFLPLPHMSELDIEYKGIGGGRQIAIGTEQCFRDHSSIDSTVSLVDDEQEL